MNCRSKIELIVYQIVFLVSLCIICVLLAVFGWFRDINPPEYNPSTSSPSKNLNNVTSVAYIPTYDHQ